MRSRILAAAFLGSLLLIATELASLPPITDETVKPVELALPIGEGQVNTTKDRVALYDPVSGMFFIGDENSTTRVELGMVGQPIAGDFDCDGRDGVGVFQSDTGRFFVDNDLDGDPDAEGRLVGGDRMLVGDFVGRDGCDEVAVYDTRRGYLRIGNSAGPGYVTEVTGYYFGVPGDEPFSGDFDGDLQTDLALHRDSTGLVYIRTRHSTGFANSEFVYGDPADLIVAGDWTGGGGDSVGVYRQRDTTIYLRYSNTLGVADEQYVYGNRSLIAVAGGFGDLPGGDPPPPPYFDASDSCFADRGVFQPTGRLIPIAADGESGSGTITYSVAVEEGIGIDPVCLVMVVSSILEDERGWEQDPEIDFQLVTSGADFRVALASPSTVDRRCAPLRTNGVYSCFNGIHSMINLTRWLNGADTVATISEYREMVINHEVGHALGYGHVGCPGPGRLAPIMMQQTIRLDGCEPNAWPLPSELNGLRRQ